MCRNNNNNGNIGINDAIGLLVGSHLIVIVMIMRVMIIIVINIELHHIIV